MFRLIHTADWQIGKPFHRFGEKDAVLREARLAAIQAIGRLAVDKSVSHVLVAGDVYDAEAPAEKTLREPLERMRSFPTVTWHLLPGNHDPHRAKGIWDRIQALRPPENVQLHLAPAPYPLGAEAVILPAPLLRKSDGRDLTEWMDAAQTAPGAIRIGLAHGSVQGFGSEGEASNPIAPDRLARARLDYLALGDWHATKQIGDRVWYSGTAEPDRFRSQGRGQVLLVEIEGAGAVPRVTVEETGTYGWLSDEVRLGEDAEVAGLDRRLRELAADPSRTALSLELTGAVSLSARGKLHELLESLRAAFFYLDVRDEKLGVSPTDEDLEAIDFSGVLRDAAERLREQAADPAFDEGRRKLAKEALVELYLRVQAGESSRGASA